MAVRKTKGNMKANSKPFTMVLWAMGQSAAYRSLSFVARGVLLELHMQYNGTNNGDLAATRTMAKDWGISSDNTLRKALKDLLAGEWIIQTRTSLFTRHGARCALYALSWYAIDECPGKGLEVAPTRAPPKTVASLIDSNSSCAKNAHGKAQ